MQINVSYDSSVSAAPSWYTAAVTAAVGQMDALIANPITLNITFSWGEENGNAIRGGTAAQNQSYGSTVDYATLYGALSAHATSTDDKTAVATLTPANPTGSGQFYVPTAMQKALGLATASGTATDGFVGLDSSLNWATNIGGAPAAGQYDPIPTIEHEISEIMGRVGYLADSQHPNQYGPMDLFRYAAPGQRALTAGAASFSIDGKTMEMPLNNPALGGDAADWAASVKGDTFGNTTAGIGSTLSATDLQLLDVLGYTIGTVPANTTAALAAASAAPAATGAASVAASAPPAVSLDTAVAFSGPRKATFTGTVSDPASTVELFRGDADLGAAQVNADGSWSLTALLSGAGNNGVSATATDRAGQSTTATSAFSITTGIRGKNYATREDIYTASGDVASSVFVRQNGETHARSRPNAAAASPTNQSVSADLDAAALLIAGSGGSHGGSAGRTFTIDPGIGHKQISDFILGGAGHDTLSLSASSFSSVADVLHHTHQVGGNTVIGLGAGDAVVLQGMSVADLRKHTADILIHG